MNELQLNNINRHNTSFWDLVNTIDWYNLSKTDKENAINNVTEFLMFNFTIDEIVEYQRNEVEKRCEIEDFIDEYLSQLPQEERAEYKLDKMETIDLASHIVGLGRTMYDYVKDNPRLIFTLQNEYLPCFGDGFDRAIYSMNTVE